MRISFVFVKRFLSLASLTSLLLGLALASSCSVAESGPSDNSRSAVDAPPVSASKGATIPIDPDGPADTVRAFYEHLRGKRFREALFLTNLRPAIEGLTDRDLQEFSLDIESIAGQVPAQVEINGEIITGEKATVTANLPSNQTGKPEIQSLNLRKEKGVWIIITVDDEAAKQIKKNGKEYFSKLRIETHEEEARKMLERISKAQLAYSLQNGGLYADLETLISDRLLPGDVRTGETTGYQYAIHTAGDKRSYYGTGTPVTYGKSGRLSFLLQLDANGASRLTSKDNGGKPLSAR